MVLVVSVVRTPRLALSTCHSDWIQLQTLIGAMQPANVTGQSQTAAHTHRLATLPARSRLPVQQTIRAAAANSAGSSKLNRVLFTIPRKVAYGQSLSVSGEGEQLGQWNPDKSLPLKWNEGDLWAAEVPLPTGQKLEYKYIVKDSGNQLQAWQPGENCAVAVPVGADASLQLVDDWHGKSRSVIFKNGEVESAPAGTFDGPPSTASSTTRASPSRQTPPLTGWSNLSEAAEQDGAYATSSSQPIKALEGIVDSGLRQGGASNGAADEVLDQETGAPLQDLRVKDLKDRLKRRGLQVSGVKAELVDRLTAATLDES